MKFFTKMARALSRRGLKARASSARPALQLQRLEGRDVPSAYGDFNGDGYDDLAIGVPGDDSNSYTQNTGAVNVIYGSAGGLAAVGNRPNQLWTQESYGVQDFAQANDRFGAALAIGNFNGDAYDDLAVGVPGEDGGAGAVNVLYGSPQGLHWAYNQFWQQGAAGLVDAAEVGDQFGAVLTTSDFNGDGFTDLAVGAPGDDVGAIVDAGGVHVLYGSVYRLTSTWDQFWTQDTPYIPGHSEADDQFGFALTAGDFNGDGTDDLAVGTPFENDEDGTNEDDVGAVCLIYGAPGSVASGRGLSLAVLPAQSWTQDTFGVEGAEEAGDWFGYALAAGDFNGDGRDDLAVGVPGEDVGAIGDAGAVHVLFGAGYGLTSTNDFLWHQDVTDVEGTADAGDMFGYAVAVGDFNGDGRADLAVGVPGEDLAGAGQDQASLFDVGAVNVLYGSPAGLSATYFADQYWNQNVPGVQDAAEAYDHFGSVLGVGDFNGDGRADLAVGVPDEDVGAAVNAGAVNVLYGSSSGGLTSNLNQFWHQDSPGVEGDAGAYDGFGRGLGRRK